MTSAGFAAPYCARSAIIVVGRISRQAELSTKKRIIASLAVCGSSPAAAMVRIAAMPAGVAALPMPSILQDRFTQISPSAFSSPGAKGISRDSGRLSARESASAAPLCRSTSSIPPKNAYAPASERQSETASPAPLSSASCAAEREPVHAAYTTLKRSMMQNTQFIPSPPGTYADRAQERPGALCGILPLHRAESVI